MVVFLTVLETAADCSAAAFEVVAAVAAFLAAADVFHVQAAELAAAVVLLLVVVVVHLLVHLLVADVDLLAELVLLVAESSVAA